MEDFLTPVDLGINGALSFILPPVFSLIIQSHWTERVKTLVAGGLCFLVALAMHLSQKGFPNDWADIVALMGNFTLIATMTRGIFKTFWKPVGVDNVTSATDISKPALVPVALPPVAPSASTQPTNVLKETPPSEEFNL